MQVYLKSQKLKCGITNDINQERLDDNIKKILELNFVQYAYQHFEVKTLTKSNSLDFINSELESDEINDANRYIINEVFEVIIIKDFNIIADVKNVYIDSIVTNNSALVIKIAKKQPSNGNVVQTFSKFCSAEFCDSRCKLNLNNYTKKGTIDVVVKANSFTDALRNEDARLLNLAGLTFTSGLNIGRSFTVKSFLQGVVTLMQMPSYSLQVGDQYIIKYGCGKTIDDCLSFNNIVNFRGFL